MLSGTGNSRYVAEFIADKLGDTVVDLNEKIKNSDRSPIAVNGKLVIATPTYAWRIPRVVTEWIEKTDITATNGVWFVMTCGGEVGNAKKFNKLLCAQKGFDYKGTAQIVMPEITLQCLMHRRLMRQSRLWQIQFVTLKKRQSKSKTKSRLRL